VRQTHPSAAESLWELCEALCPERGGRRAAGAHWLPCGESILATWVSQNLSRGSGTLARDSGTLDIELRKFLCISLDGLISYQRIRECEELAIVLRFRTCSVYEVSHSRFLNILNGIQALLVRNEAA
jgi:hypothetical protein